MLLHPFVPYLLAAVLIGFSGRALRSFLLLAAPVVSFFFLLSFVSAQDGTGAAWSLQAGGREWLLLRTDKLSLLFACAVLAFSFFANLFALHLKDRMVSASALLYAGSSVGAVLAGDLAVLFVFWEIMAAASAVVIWDRRRPASLAVIYRYLLVHGAGGLLFFAAIAVRLAKGESLAFGLQTLDTTGWFLFLAFSVNAALPPLHAWLPDAYPSARPEGSVFLSAFTTKVAVYAFIRGFAGSELLVYLGAAAAVYGVVFALMENDMRRLLSYHIICQVGYMLAGAGLGSTLGIAAGAAHAVGNIFFKGLLFMAVGAVILQTRRTRLSDLGGLAKRSPWVLFFFLAGAFSISGVPLLNGYVSKSLLTAAAAKAHLAWLEITLYVVAVGTFVSIALKLCWFAFFGHAPAPKRLAPLPRHVYAAMAGCALVCLAFGLVPEWLYRLLPGEIHYPVYTAGHVLQTCQLLLAAYLGFLFFLPRLHVKPVISLDTDWFYRKGGQIFVKGVCYPLRQAQEVIQKGWSVWIARMGGKADTEREKQAMPPAGYALLWITAGFLFAGIAMLAAAS